jgi:hypothetical protein
MEWLHIGSGSIPVNFYTGSIPISAHRYKRFFWLLSRLRSDSDTRNVVGMEQVLIQKEKMELWKRKLRN